MIQTAFASQFVGKLRRNDLKLRREGSAAIVVELRSDDSTRSYAAVAHETLAAYADRFLAIDVYSLAGDATAELVVQLAPVGIVPCQQQWAGRKPAGSLSQ